MINKAAMFGLDARIALAIFGALSVISGAALYSAIKEAKLTQIHTNFVEFGKAVEAYYLDTGSLPKSSFGTYYTSMLINKDYDSTVKNWQGPYINGSASGFSILNKWVQEAIGTQDLYSATISLKSYSSNTWTNAMLNPNICQKGDDNCALYILITNQSDDSEIQTNMQKLFTELDNKYDNGDGALTGKWRTDAYANPYSSILFSYMPV